MQLFIIEQILPFFKYLLALTDFVYFFLNINILYLICLVFVIPFTMSLFRFECCICDVELNALSVMVLYLFSEVNMA